MLSLSILHHLREPLKELKYVRLLSKYFYFLSGFSIKQVGDFAEQRHLTLKARNVLLSGKFKQCINSVISIVVGGFFMRA